MKVNVLLSPVKRERSINIFFAIIGRVITIEKTIKKQRTDTTKEAQEIKSNNFIGRNNEKKHPILLSYYG